MQIVEQIDDLRLEVRRAKSGGKIIGFVPTMGALHNGHLTLIRRSVDNNDFTIVSIFVNPTQFGPSEDFDRYPRTIDSDLDKCRAEGVDLVFVPSVSEMYPQSFGTWVDVGDLTEVMEGASRPGHFLGVATVVLKLLNQVTPHRAYFGMKDYQQLKVIQKMVRDLDLDVEIVPVPTMRELDGLAMSSRNANLSHEERCAAAVIHRALKEAERMVSSGKRGAKAIQSAVEKVIRAEPLAELDYVAVVDPETLRPVGSVHGSVLIALAVRIGETRLIDNILISSQ